MNFLHNMDISESTLRIDDNFLDLVDFETILTGKHNTNILIDLIGQILDLGDLDTVHCTGGKERKKLEFTLRDINDSGDSLAITISDSGDNKLDKKLVSHKWMQCQEKNLAELVESTEAPLLLQDNEPNEAASTPSKRKNEENKDTPDKTSTSKKLCTKVIKKEKK
ncbi:unnamed protein product [Brassica napus]|nr:unnamed protein product [Brassica napus]